jgi:hypothetical protein
LNILPPGLKRKHANHNYKALDSHGTTDTLLPLKKRVRTSGKALKVASKFAKLQPKKSLTYTLLPIETPKSNNNMSNALEEE